MDHTGSFIFHRNYLSRMIRYDIQAAYRGTAPRADWIRAAGRMNRLMDPRRPKKLTTRQKDAISSEAAIQALRARQNELFRQIRAKFQFIYKAKGEPIHDVYQRARLDTYGAMRQRERAVLREIQKEYDATAPLQDIQEQINGNTEAVNARLAAGLVEYSFPERFRIAKAFLESELRSVDDSSARLALINDLILLCHRQEIRRCTRPRKAKTQPCGIAVNVDDLEREPPQVKEEPTDAGTDDKPLIPFKCQPYQCLICLGQARLPLDERLKNYGGKYSLKRHFHRFHKQFEFPTPCPHSGPSCAKVVLATRTLFLNHAAIVHEINMDEKTWRISDD